jgi:hypothetical protein
MTFPTTLFVSGFVSDFVSAAAERRDAKPRFWSRVASACAIVSVIALAFLLADALPVFAQGASLYDRMYDRTYGRNPEYYTDEGAYNSPAQTSTSELGLRYLKLGNTHREARNFESASFYLSRGLDLVRGRGSKYWEAVANEYLGLLHRDMNNKFVALDYMRRAENIYKAVLTPLRSQSSLDASRKIIRDIEFAAQYFPADYSRNWASYSSFEPYSSSSSRAYTRQYEQELRLDNDRLQRANSALNARLGALEMRIRQLEYAPR